MQSRMHESVLNYFDPRDQQFTLSTPYLITNKVSQREKPRVGNLLGIYTPHSSILQLRTKSGQFSATISRAVR